uniref:Protein kinase domain-containing protein n=2 Tax=Odontella aurita TaxID=265563 RepID=A0A7S4IJ44_9STRA|mmetsp:Transcript_25772/g.76069  ORF Transcript_25772/g.76069 Transcript_25772/m.76069 type:complete len:332 (+) Transcript_25772:772-1767(+)
MDLLGGVMSSDVAYIGHGFFRQTFMLRGATNGSSGEGSTAPDVALKMLRWRPDQDDFIVNRMEKTRMDALVMERLTSSPRITNVHGHCAFSVATESLPGEVMDYVVPTNPVIKAEELHDEDGVDNKNGMSPAEKLDLALTAAEGLAELHGFEDGVIVHDDIDLGQFLRTPSGQVKLNDFNRAKPMLWDPEEQKYCKYYNGGIGGKVRAPEEFTDPPGILNEKMDIFAMGNMFYGILTGLHPFYFTRQEEAERRLIKGGRPFIDERWRKHSFAERKLIEAIERCWIHDPEERADVFWVVKFLKEAVGENINHRQDETDTQTLARDTSIVRYD